jgi:glycosyltransferase involved in cell wall biosynthesis
LAALIARAISEGAPFRLVALAASLARRAQRERWQHVHASFATYPAWLAWATAHLARLPFSFTAHAYDVQEPRPWLARLAAEAAFVRAISLETAARVRAAAGHAARVHVGHLGVDVERFRPGAGPAADPPEILTVARIGPTKGIEVLIEAAGLLARNPTATPRRFRLRVLGDGPSRDGCVTKARALGLDEVVFFEGAASNREVALALQRATVFALPCVRAREGARHDGLPVALLEAMASALPVVSTPVGGIPEAISNGNDGILVPSGDAHALAASLAMLLEDAALRRRLGVAARARVLRQFRGDTAAARLAEWMNDACPDQLADRLERAQSEARG